MAGCTAGVLRTVYRAIRKRKPLGRPRSERVRGSVDNRLNPLAPRQWQTPRFFQTSTTPAKKLGDGSFSTQPAILLGCAGALRVISLSFSRFLSLPVCVQLLLLCGCIAGIAIHYCDSIFSFFLLLQPRTDCLAPLSHSHCCPRHSLQTHKDPASLVVSAGPQFLFLLAQDKQALRLLPPHSIPSVP